MKTKAIITSLVFVSGLLAFAGKAQDDNYHKNEYTTEQRHAKRPIRPDTFEQVDSVRNVLGLDHKQFEKVYAAYNKYNKAVFGEEQARPSGERRPPMDEGARRQGRPGPRGGDRMGGPRGPRSGAPGFGGNRRSDKKIDIQKFEETKARQETKLCKEMMKTFKNDTTLYNEWLIIRSAQLERMFPTRSSEENPQ